MSYTKQTWNTGDIITADKLNHMEDGITSAQVYSVSEAVLFSGSVTTEENGGSYGAEIDCDLSDEPEQIKVVFDGTEYTCEKIDEVFGPIYGGFGAEYPFAISYNNRTVILTETASTHQVNITAPTKSVNEDLGDAIDNKINSKVVVVSVNGTRANLLSNDVADAASQGAFICYRIIGENSFSYITNFVVTGNAVNLTINNQTYTHNGTLVTKVMV